MSKKKFISIYVAIGSIIFLTGCNTYIPKADTSYINEVQSDYSIIENRFVVEMNNIHIDIRYPQISIYSSSSSQDGFKGNVNRQIDINKLLTPPEIQNFNNMIADGFIKISSTGEFEYNSSPHTYELGMDCSYTMGFMNNGFINLYRRSICYTRNSDWNYEALLIDMSSGTQIMPKDFFDAAKFNEYFINGSFKANKEDFDIDSLFKNNNEEQISQYLSHTFINQNKQIETIVIYGEGLETIISADLDKVIEIIKPEYFIIFKY